MRCVPCRVYAQLRTSASLARIASPLRTSLASLAALDGRDKQSVAQVQLAQGGGHAAAAQLLLQACNEGKAWLGFGAAAAAAPAANKRKAADGPCVQPAAAAAAADGASAEGSPSKRARRQRRPRPPVLLPAQT